MARFRKQLLAQQNASLSLAPRNVRVDPKRYQDDLERQRAAGKLWARNDKVLWCAHCNRLQLNAMLEFEATGAGAASPGQQALLGKCVFKSPVDDDGGGKAAG